MPSKSLDLDVLSIIFEYLLLMHAKDSESHPSVASYLMSLSETCRVLRMAAMPIIFREGHNWKMVISEGLLRQVSPSDAMWPSTVWQYIRKLHVHDFDEGGEAINLSPLVLVLPKLPAVKHIRFQLRNRPPADLLLASSLILSVDTVEFHTARFDGPSLACCFARWSHLRSLAIFIDLYRKEDLNLGEEFENIRCILQTLAGNLGELEISGDLVGMLTLSAISWPYLRKLVLTDHIPFGETIPLTTMVVHMPSLRILALNFTAVITWKDYDPIIFCFHAENTPSPPLSSVLPDLRVLSISNALPEDPIFQQLPPNLEVLRLLALRDPLRRNENLQQPWYGYSTLNEAAAFRVIQIAGGFPLVELALNLEKAPSPAILQAIAASCPSLRILELEAWRHEINDRESQYSIASLIQPLVQLQHLRDLRLSLELGHHVDSGYRIFPMFRVNIKRRMNAAAQQFAEGLPQLHYIGFSFWNNYTFDGLTRHLIWYWCGIFRGRPEEPPVVKFLKYL
ncbi:hypothetical protein Hypma_005022 [Hypsizygus marmoreus]|uniref:F-box domain-containing protein n=1 Tax=Hypsizygus marmoreus TaxID=39966 RepID=A0A369K543_HYPMA|nr:hypothetical protein Hypma_005022 [Hypsizygus marmoreus]